MSRSRLEWKVGVFVFIGLVLLGILLIQFSKGAAVLRPTYDIRLKSSNVSGLKKRADVMVSGVQVGSVSDVELAPDSKSVTMVLTIYSRFRIHKDARFVIEQAGFLGDQYIAIYPQSTDGTYFQDGDEAWSEPPFNFQEVARTASGLVERVQQTTEELTRTLASVRSNLLNDATLTNLSLTVSNLRAMSDRAVTTVDSLNLMLETNSSTIALTTSNLAGFSTSIKQVAASLNEVVNTNTPVINSALQNVEASSVALKNVMADLEAGKGLAGNLLRNEQLSDSVSGIAYNLSITSSNLNRLGLWGILWGRKSPPPQPPPDKLYTPKDKNFKP